MFKRLTVICLAVMLMLQSAALAKAKDEIPMNERIKIAVEVKDSTNFVNLDTAELLRGMLIDELSDANIFNILDAPAERTSDIKTLGDKSADVGKLLIFNRGKKNLNDDAIFIPESDTKPVDDNQAVSENLNADYVMYCEILGIGTTKGEMDSYSIGNDVGVGIGIGTGRHTHIGVGVGIFGTVGGTKRTFFATIVNAKLIKVDTDTIMFQHNEIGEALRPRKPSKGYDDVNSEAYLKSIKDAAKDISKSVVNYTKKHLIKK